MYIKEIEIDNFKSFANQVTIPFLPGFTTISGPNGSGKSNIIDSVLFALGLSSSRTLRAEKLYHLISTHNKRNDASVKITFTDNGENNILTVERRLRKAPSGFVSSYFINGKSTTLSNIHETLSPYNISPGSYNVIMQGDVTSITNTSSTERRKILDEIAGVADFDRRIESATKELESVEETVGKSNIRLEEVAIRLNQLEEDRKQALKYQELKEEKQKYDGQINVVKYFDIKTSIERLHESILEATKTKKEQEKELKKLDTELEQTMQKLQEISLLVRTKGEDEQIEIKKQAEVLKAQISLKEESIKYIEKQAHENAEGIKDSQNSIVKLKEKIEATNLRIDNKKDEIKIIEQNIVREKEELQRILSDISGLNQTANEHVEKRNHLRKKLENRQDEENLLIKEKLPLEEKFNRNKRDVEEAKTVIERIEENKKVFEEKKDLLDLQVHELSDELKGYEISQKNILYELDKVRNELDDSNYNISLAYKKVAQLEANKRASEDANYGRAIDTIMNAGLDGIHAPLAQLGKVDKKYSSALSIAMGGRMTNIVVEDDEVASVAIEILKTSNAGRATFLPLNKIQKAKPEPKIPKDSGIIDFALNLIDFDDVYLDAFYHAVGDTLVVQDLNVARKYAGKFRMVTLDGSLVEKSGSMTGGSVGRSSLQFSSNDGEELDIYKSRLKELEDKSRSLGKRKFDLEEKQNKIRHEYSSVMNELNTKKLELENLKRNAGEAKETIEAKIKLIEELEPQIVLIEKQIALLEEKQAGLKEEIATLTSQIVAVESELPKDELSKLNELTESVEFEIKRHEAQVLNCENEIKQMQMEIGFNQDGIQTQEERIVKLGKDNETFATDKENHKATIINIQEKLSELNEKISKIGETLIELQQQRDDSNQEVLNCEKRKNILETKIERTTEQIEAYKARRAEYEPQLFTIREELTEAGHNISTLEKPDISIEEVEKKITSLARRMEAMGDINMKAITEYDEVMERQLELKGKLDTLSKERMQILERMESYEDLKRKTFLETFNNVNENFKDIFAQLSDGEGQLILEKPEDPLSGGLTIEARPRDKKMQRLESMSGGEKSLTALAFVFSIQRYLPAPFYAFDEVDMHLDGINVEKLSDMIRKQAQNTQFIVVSLRKPMIEAANRTVGVTQKDSGITKVTGVKFSE